eukprot:9503934-Pyramimonas_sp.AAC.2
MEQKQASAEKMRWFADAPAMRFVSGPYCVFNSKNAIVFNQQTGNALAMRPSSRQQLRHVGEHQVAEAP